MVIENSSSKYTAVTSGIPQGTVLGPTLFFIYMKDELTFNINCSKIRLYADDITIYREVATANDAEIATSKKNLKALQHWEQV